MEQRTLFSCRLPMGLKTAAMACQRSTSAVCYMFTQEGCYVVNYLDDFIGVASPDKALQDYDTSGFLLRDFKGLPTFNCSYVSRCGS